MADIEEDVLKRVIVSERRNPAGLVESLGAIEGGSNIIKGLFTLSASEIAKGIGQFGLAKLQKNINDTDNIIKRSFGKFNQSVQSK